MSGCLKTRAISSAALGKGGDAAVRRNFLGTAFWNARIAHRCGRQGEREFPAPDGLTRYRVMAVTQSERDQFGHTETSFEINKPLMLEPAPPRFANVGRSDARSRRVAQRDAQAGRLW